jgi:tetratricopeptide (TPR) repeat protein
MRLKTLGEEDRDTSTSVINLTGVLRDQGEYEQAEEMNRRALAGSEKVLGVDHPSALTSVGNLAGVLQYQGEYKQAEEMNRRALAGYEKVLGVDHPDTLTSVYCPADLLDAKQDQHETLNLHARTALTSALCSLRVQRSLPRPS